MTRPKVIGVCGLIGSGKSVVRRSLQALYGLPTFDTDTEAKRLYFDPKVREEVKEELGIDPIKDNLLDKNALNKVFSEPSTRVKLERIVHTALLDKMNDWFKEYSTSPVVVIESALLYMSGFYRTCDVVIAVTAPTDVRLKRVLGRDGAGRESRFFMIDSMQMQEGIRQEEESDFKVTNDDRHSIIRQLEQLQDTLLIK